MSLKYRNSQGVETPVAGLNGTSGELVPSVALQQSGTTTSFNVGASTFIQVTINFDTPMPDTDYTVIAEPISSASSVAAAGITVTVGSKTVNGLMCQVYNSYSAEQNVKLDWTAFKLMTDTVHEADAAHIAQNASDLEKLKAYTPVSNTDADTLTTTGLYYLTTGCTNVPSNYCILQVQSKNTTVTGDDIAQYAINTEGNQYSRVRVNGIWTSWQKLVTASENNFKYQVCITDTDLNDIKASGAYSIYISDPTSQATNHAPTYGWLQLSVIQMNNSLSFCNQVLYSADGKMFTRECGNDSWSDWKQISDDLTSGTLTIPAQTLANGTYAEVQIPLVPGDFYCGRIDFADLPSQNMSLSYNDFSGSFQDTKGTNQRTQDVLYPIGRANLATLHVYLTNYTGSPVTISDINVIYYLEHHKAQ